MSLRVGLVDDQEVFLRAARALLEGEGVDVAATGADSAAAERMVRDGLVDVVLVDLRLGDEDGLAVADRLRRATDVRVIVMSSSERDDVADLLAAGPGLPFIQKRDLSAASIRDALDAIG